MLDRKALAQSQTRNSTTIRVLIADPDEPLQAVYRETLGEYDFEVTTAYSGLECIAHLKQYVPDVLVIDPLLPWGGGDGVLSRMGEVPVLTSIPVMVLTSCRDSRIMNRMSRFPISDYQIKPLSSVHLAKRLRTLATGPRQHFSLAEQTDHIKCTIAKRTGGRIRNLHVETVDGRIVATGRCDSQDVRQRAAAAVREVFKASESQTEKIELNIIVD